MSDKNFYECDEHLWLLGERELPEDIGWDRGPDWLCLHRSFVEYAITGTDPLLQGLKELYKYTMFPVEVYITKTYLCDILQYFTDVKAIIIR